MFWTDIPADGDYAITPPKKRGQGANTYDSSEVTTDEAGTVVVDGTGTVTIGYFTNVSESASFIAYEDGLMDKTDAYVRHGKGVRLAVRVTGASNLRIGYAGASK